ncbi:MAG TPA: hypothetical protein VEL07_21910 [Planctomycetota bacterium]|nr:hypothetical protein [Planctomycetota bacterium]
MREPSDESYVSLHREIAEAIAARRYRLAISLIDLCDVRATTEQQRDALAHSRGSLEAALRLEDLHGAGRQAATDEPRLLDAERPRPSHERGR